MPRQILLFILLARLCPLLIFFLLFVPIHPYDSMDEFIYVCFCSERCVTTHLSRFYYHYLAATSAMSVYIVMLCWYEVSYCFQRNLLMFTLLGTHVWNECFDGPLIFVLVFLGFLFILSFFLSAPFQILEMVKLLDDL